MNRSIDETDARILAVLQNNARLSNKEIAARVGVAPSTCLERTRRLQDDGVLLGYHADVSPKAVGATLQAMVAVRLRIHALEDVERFQAHVRGLAAVRDVYYLAGANDFLVHVSVRDTDHLRELILGAFANREEVGHVETALIYDHYRNPVLPDYRSADR